MRLGRTIRIGLVSFAVVLVLAITAGAIAIARFNPNSFKPQIATAVEQATGRKFVLNGPISLDVSLSPVVQLNDVSLANPPEFSRSTMASLQRLDMQLALWPLLFGQLNIDRLVLVRPDIWLEKNAQGETTGRSRCNNPGQCHRKRRRKAAVGIARCKSASIIC